MPIKLICCGFSGAMPKCLTWPVLKHCLRTDPSMATRLKLVLLLLAAAVLIAAIARASDSFYCGEQLIEIEDSEQDVLTKCGVPDYTETWEEELIQKPQEAFERSTRISYAEWIYDLGTNHFIRVLLFRDGVLKDVQTRGYGPGPTTDCTSKTISVGDTKFEVLRKCGQPQARKHTTEKRMEPIDAVHRRRYPITVERWTYMPKGGALARTIVFRNRRVVDIESGNNP